MWVVLWSVRTRPFPAAVARENEMMDKKTLLIAQILINCMMAASMSGIMSAIGMGIGPVWFSAWPKQLLIAWPIAFVMTQITSGIAFAIVYWMRPPTARALQTKRD